MKAVVLGTSANLIKENPSGTSAPSNSTVDGGSVGTRVAVSVGTSVVVSVVVGGRGVSVEDVAVTVGEVTVAVPGWQAASVNAIKTKSPLKISVILLFAFSRRRRRTLPDSRQRPPDGWQAHNEQNPYQNRIDEHPILDIAIQQEVVQDTQGYSEIHQAM